MIFSREIKPLIFGVFKDVTPLLFAYVEHKGAERLTWISCVLSDFLRWVSYEFVGFQVRTSRPKWEINPDFQTL